MIKRILKRIFRMIRIFRQFYYYNFNNSYVMKSMAKRKGKCKSYGQCCWDCYELTPPDKDGKVYCKVYTNRPKWCKYDFPFDKWDLKLSMYKRCGFWWDK